MAQHYCKFYKQRKYVSYDGITWQPLNEYRKGALYEEDSSDCGYMTEYKWQLVDGYLCSGTTEYQKLQKYESVDGGISWYPSTPEEYQIGDIIRENSLNCVLEKWVYTIEDGDKPTSFCPEDGSNGAYMDEGIAKRIRFTSGIRICDYQVIDEGAYCRTTLDHSYAQAYDSAYDHWFAVEIGKATTNCTSSGPNVVYNDFKADGKAVSGNCYQCCSCCQTCTCWIITEYMPWLENTDTIKKIYKQKYTRATTADTWTAVAGTKQFYSLGERWVKINESITQSLFQHQLANVDEYGNITWEDEGSSIVYNNDVVVGEYYEYIDELFNDNDSYVVLHTNLSGSYGAKMWYSARYGSGTTPSGTVAQINNTNNTVDSYSVSSCTHTLGNQSSFSGCFSTSFNEYYIYSTNQNTWKNYATLFVNYTDNRGPVTYGSPSQNVYIRYAIVLDTDGLTTYGNTVWRPVKISGTDIRGMLADDGVTFRPLSKYLIRWTESGTTCYAYDKCKQLVMEYSTDGGSTYSATPVTKVGDVIEANSTECGYGTFKIYMKGLTENITASTQCDSSSAVTSADIPSVSSYYLYEAHIGNCVNSIGDNTFNGFENMIGHVAISSSVRNIGNSAFKGCQYISSTIDLSHVQTIGNSAFSGCTRALFTSYPNATSIGAFAFSYCHNISEYVIPDSVTSVGEYAYAYSYVESQNNDTLNTERILRIGSGITTIPNGCFMMCGQIQNVTIPSNVTSIGDSAFGSCYRIKNLSLPEGLLTIGSGAFTNLYYVHHYNYVQGYDYYNPVYSGITQVTIPSTVTSIGANAFAGCGKLERFTVLATTPPTLGSGAFNDCSSSLKIFVPSGSVDAYKASWSEYSDKIFTIP